MKITKIRLGRLRLELDPPCLAAWDPQPRPHFDATVVRVKTDEGVTGIGSGDNHGRLSGLRAPLHPDPGVHVHR